MNNFLYMRKNKLTLVFIAIFIVSFLFVFKYSQGQADNVNNNQIPGSASGSGDAIGVRIVPNLNHYSVRRWYESQGFKGSPQALVVDGYEAIRDGRTVYVNAANVNTTTKNIHTNIYLISYNQDPAAKTVDILGQIISHWKFNSNITESDNPVPSCSISSLYCSSDKDCGKGQACMTSDIPNPVSPKGTCYLTTTKNCAVDSDCPTNFFCTSLKAKIIRDLKRIGQLEELKEALFSFKKINNHYPLLTAGSYLSNHTISVWPSWTKEFLSSLAVTKSFVDPINRLGDCTGYDRKTCWNEKNKKFIYDPTPDYLMLPQDSYAFVYKTDSNGSNYNLCAVMESREPSLGYHFSPNDPVSSVCVTATGIISGGLATNTPPILVDKSLIGEAGMEFNGFLKVVDQENNPLTWTFSPSGAYTDWSALPVLKGTNNINQKKIYSPKAGVPGVYNATLIVTDNHIPNAGVLNTSIPIKIINPTPFIEAEDDEYVLDQTVPFVYSFYFSDNNIVNPAQAVEVSFVSGSANSFNLFNTGELSKTVTSVGINKYKVTYSGLISTSHKFYQDTTFVNQIKVTDSYDGISTKQFTIKFIITKPQFNLGFNCSTNLRLNQAYSCFLGLLKQGSHDLTYSNSNPPLPVGLLLTNDFYTNLSRNNQKNGRLIAKEPPAGFLNNFYSFFFKPDFALAESVPPSPQAKLGAFIKGTPTVISSGHKAILKVANEYGASTTKEVTFKISNYCGDGQKQAPNLEGRGGFYNDGYEDCDGLANVTNDPKQSSVEVQYGCMTGVGETTPNPITNNNYCIFKSPLDGGGFCGDDICEPAIETVVNCYQDCVQTATICVTNCKNKECGSDGCGGQCLPGCGAGESCNPSGQCVTNCNPNCYGKKCGSDGCGGQCLPGCGAGESCNPSGQCVPQTNCNGLNGCKTCNGADCLCDLNTQLCKNGLCYFKNTCRCSSSNLSSSLDICLAPNSANNTCCSSSETCCNGACQNDPNHLLESCGYNCCNKATQSCCGTSAATKNCYNKSNLMHCNDGYCCPDKVCCRNEICVDPKDCYEE